jgi:hypothetical protein
MQKQEDQSMRKNHSGVTTEPVSINRIITLQKEISRKIKTSGVQIRN